MLSNVSISGANWSGVKTLLVGGRESCFSHALVNEPLTGIVDHGIVQCLDIVHESNENLGEPLLPPCFVLTTGQ